MEEELEIIGIIESKSVKIAPDDTWKRIAFTMYGEIFSTFDTDLDTFIAGDVVKLKYKQNGKYNNIISIEKCAENSIPSGEEIKEKGREKMNELLNKSKEQKKIDVEDKNNNKKDWKEDMIDFDTLLRQAHKNGIISINTEVVAVDFDKKRALFKATVTGNIGDVVGTFTAHGDSTDENIKSSSIKPHFVRMAETRAVARALRFYTNNAKVSDVETD